MPPGGMGRDRRRGPQRAQPGDQLVAPRPPGLARVLSPTYNEHAAALAARAGGGAGDGSHRAPGPIWRWWSTPTTPTAASCRRGLLALLPEVGALVVDESFADATPEISLAGETGRPASVLRSFGKFYGLAGLRLGFALSEAGAAPAGGSGRAVADPGAAIAIGCKALVYYRWQAATIAG